MENRRTDTDRYRLGEIFSSYCCSILREHRIAHSQDKMRDRNNGGVAQLGEHLPCKQGVMGSNPIISTTRKARSARGTEASVERKRTMVERTKNDRG